MNEIVQTQNLPAAAPVRRPVEIRVVNDPIAVLDTGRFEHMQRVANIMASCSMIPESLYKKDDELLAYETVVANCFLITNQSVRWSMDPFAVAQSVSVIHGKLCYEGKLIAAVIEARLGVRLRYKWNAKTGDAFGIEVSGTFPDGTTETIDGTVADWRMGAKSPWADAKNHKRMLAYRGSREWARLFAPGLMLGVISDDEIEAVNSRRNSQQIEAPPDPDLPAIETTAGAAPAARIAAPTVVADDPPLDPIEELVGRLPDEKPALATTQKPAAGDGLDIPASLDRRGQAPSMDDPEKWLAWLNKKCATFSTYDALEAWWNDKIAPSLGDLFPPDQEEAVGVFRKHERRLEP